MSLTRTPLMVVPRSGLATMRLEAPWTPPLPLTAPPARRRRLTPALVAVGAALLLLATSVEWSDARSVRFPVTEYGQRGANVMAIQYLLQHRGYEIPATGWYGPMTRDAIKRYQRRHRLPITGVVDGRTWLRMAPDVIIGMKGHHVRAVQVLLNEKLPASLAVDGVFGPLTEAATMAFQRRHRMEPDGGVGPLTWTRLVAQFSRPAFSRPSVCAYATGANGHHAHYGTAAVTGAIEWVGRYVHRRGHGPASVGDVSGRSGGFLPGHRMHRHGLEVDLRPMRHDRAQCTARTVWYRWSGNQKVCCNPSYDREATRALIRGLRSSGLRVREIAFNDPALVREGLTRYYPGHDDHVHVTFCERGHPEAYYRC